MDTDLVILSLSLKNSVIPPAQHDSVKWNVHVPPGVMELTLLVKSFPGMSHVLGRSALHLSGLFRERYLFFYNQI